MDGEVATIVSVRFLREKSSFTNHQVIDNGSGVCKAGCKYIFRLSSTLPFVYSPFQSLVSPISQLSRWRSAERVHR